MDWQPSVSPSNEVQEAFLLYFLFRAKNQDCRQNEENQLAGRAEGDACSLVGWDSPPYHQYLTTQLPC